MAEIYGLFIRTKKTPHRWVCKVQKIGRKYEEVFNRLWLVTADTVGDHRVRAVKTSALKLSEREMKQLGRGLAKPKEENGHV